MKGENMKEQEREELHRTIWSIANEECVKVTNNNKLTEDNIKSILSLVEERKEIVAKEAKLRAAIDKIVAELNDGLTPARAAPCGGGTGLTPAQQNRRRR